MKRLTISGSWLAVAVTLILFAPEAKAQPETPLTDPEIASVAVTANQIDVDYGELALKNSNNEDIRKFAITMIADHQNIIQEATELAKRLHVTPQTNAMTQSLFSGEAATMKTLKAKRGEAFDKAYVQNEAAYHKAVVEAVKTRLIPETQNAELKGLLQSVLPLLEHHAMMANEMASKF